MRAFDVVMFVIAAVCFTLAALSIGHPRLNLLALGLLAWVLVPLVAILSD